MIPLRHRLVKSNREVRGRREEEGVAWTKKCKGRKKLK
jgi:hypothetical protein